MTKQVSNETTPLDPDATFAPYHFHFTEPNPWKLADSDRLIHLLETRPPEFTTILGIAEIYNPEPAAETRYAGPLYFDLDGSLDEVIPQFKKLLSKFVNQYQLDLEQVRLFATGGRGFHIHIPYSVFMPGVDGVGTLYLPQIYKEMAMELFVDCLDHNVYSSKKGRMWRVANRQRDNGNFKVPITVEEAFAMTPEGYADIVSAPRAWPRLRPPTLNIDLAILYSQCQDKVIKMMKARSTAIKIDADLRKRFKGKFPPSVKALMDGKVASPEGFNKVALQLSLLAHAIGVGEEDFLRQCAVLISNHASDGRYNTPARRETELRGQFKYARNSTYFVSVGGLKSILPKGFRTPDLAGLGVKP